MLLRAESPGNYKSSVAKDSKYSHPECGVEDSS